MPPPTDDDRVREHLANERTYLAWLRSGMSMMGFGVVIAKIRYLFLMANSVTPSTDIIHASKIGFLFAIIGLFMVMISGWRFVVVQKQIREQNYRSMKRIIVILSTIVIGLGVIILWYLIKD